MNDLQRRRQINETKLANIQIVQCANLQMAKLKRMFKLDMNGLQMEQK